MEPEERRRKVMRSLQAVMTTDRVARRGAALLLLIAAILLTGAGVGQDRALSQSCEGPGYAEDHIIVGMKEGASEEAIQRMKDINGAGEERELMTNIWTVDLPDGYNVPEAEELYERDPDVEYAHPDYMVHTEGHCPRTVAALQTTISDSPDPVAVGERLVYKISMHNEGPDQAINVAVNSYVPNGAEFVSARFVNGENKGSCAANEMCEVGNVSVGETATVSVALRPLRLGGLSYLAQPTADNGPEISVEVSERTTVMAPGYCTIVGTEGDDRLVGSAGRDVICAFGGNDLILPEGGNNLVHAGSGDDHIEGTGFGKDRLFGGPGDDTIYARDGIWQNDLAVGGLGRDSITVDRGDKRRN